MNHQELTQKISSKFHLRRSFSKKLLGLICNEITQELRREKRVYLRKLGVFHPIQRPARRYYDLRTKKIKIKPAHKDIIFRPGKYLLRQIVALPMALAKGGQTMALWPKRNKNKWENPLDNIPII